MWDVYLTNFMFRRRQTRTEYKKKDARVEIRVKVDGCRVLEAGMTSVERDQLLPTTPEVSFEIVITVSCSW